MIIKELTSKEEIMESYPLMNQLRTELSLQNYVSLVEDMTPQGYRLMALYDENLKIVSLAGFTILTNLYYLKHIWVYDLITDAQERSKGYGELLLKHLEELARTNECNCIALSSGFARKDAHRFYENKMGFDKSSYSFVKMMD